MMMDLGAMGLYAFKAKVHPVSAAKRFVSPLRMKAGHAIGQKPKQALPERTGYFYCYSNQEIFLAQRPLAVLWGGLYCFPQFASG